jgi:hypothetical protein
MGSLQFDQKSSSLGIIGLMEVIPAISMALFAGHFVDQKKKKGLFSNVSWFSIISLGLFFIYMASFIKDFTTQTILYSIYFSCF